MLAQVDRRKLIVQAAAQSFALFGYKATTMDQVAKIANVGKGTIYTFLRIKKSCSMRFCMTSFWR